MHHYNSHFIDRFFTRIVVEFNFNWLKNSANHVLDDVTEGQWGRYLESLSPLLCELRKSLVRIKFINAAFRSNPAWCSDCSLGAQPYSQDNGITHRYIVHLLWYHCPTTFSWGVLIGLNNNLTLFPMGGAYGPPSDIVSKISKLVRAEFSFARFLKKLAQLHA